MNGMNRRSFLRLSGAGATAAAFGAGLAACSTTPPRSSVKNSGKSLVDWPRHSPFAGPKPDLPANQSGVQNAYLRYPEKLVTSVPEIPGDGSDVTALIITYSPPPKGLENNPWWQAINKALGVNLKIVLAPDADYVQKLSTIMASDDLPDIIMLGGGYLLPRVEEFVASKCADLSDFLGGDAIGKYPNLANIPPYAWKSMGRIDGRLFGIPIERPLPGNSLMVNRTALDSVGAPRNWTREQFSAAIKALTSGRRWGIGGAKEGMGGSSLHFHAGSLGAPNGWKVTDGKFETTFGTEEYLEAIDISRQLYADKLFYPDSMSVSQVNLESLYYNGSVATINDGYGTYISAVPQVGNKFVVDFGLPYGTDGGAWQGSGIFGYSVFRKAEPARLEMLLRICNYLAAPFGTNEYELATYGVEGKNFVRGDSGVELTESTKKGEDLSPPFRYIAAPPGVIFNPGRPDAAERVHQWQSDVLPSSVRDPSIGLRSATFTQLGASLNRNLKDAAAAIIAGRQPISSWTQAVQSWKTKGGDKIAEELAEEHAATD